MNWLIFYAASAAWTLSNGIHAGERHQWWWLALDLACFAVIAPAAWVHKREVEQEQHRNLIRAFDAGRLSILREQREMRQRSQR